MAALSSRRGLNYTVLPLVLFPVISSFGGKSIFGIALNKSLASAFDAQCSGSSPGCGIIVFFAAALDPETVPFTTHFLINIAPVPVFILVEAARSGRSPWLSSVFGTVLGLAYQVASAAAIMPLYWMTLVLASHPSRPVEIDEAHAESITFAAIAGFLIPTTYMLMTADTVVIIVWQFFPLLMLIAQRLHLLVRPPSKVGPRSGRKTIQALYGLLAVAAALAHLTVVWPIRNDLPAIRQTLFPRILSADEFVTPAEGARNLLQFDSLFSFTAAMIGALWFARNAREAVAIALWLVSTSVTLGPGAALATVYAWRENRAVPA